ncbi:Heterokaryon incompatibility protein 6- OR allele [Apiospora hydei]|uniref:Heterokaryon incompatibility protein 6- OR allele n=1 Tax=Apiospora hydei TaxID=1337664 RepID=A0ABR1XBH5_9PEZI
MASLENPFSRLMLNQSSSSTAVARLAVLEPSDDPDSPIRLTLTDAPLASTSYECISYNHEDEGTTKVLVDDAEQEIPNALESALRIFRRREQPRKVWADLLVGRTVEERNVQGPFMRQILSNADKTLCWLGSGESELTSLAFDTIRDMANRYLQACLHVGLSQDVSISRITLQQMEGIRARLHDCPFDDLHSFNFDLWKVIDGVFGSPYWSSVHAIPDIVSAQLAIVVCGRSNIRWPNYIAAARSYPFFRGKFFGGVPLLPSVQKGFEMANQIEIAERRRRLGQSIELFPMIQTARDCGAKDVRENVFAMLKIATPSARVQFHTSGEQPLPTIDYSKTPQQVFTEAARYTVLERQDLMVWFGECPPCQKILKGLPSWVPDFGANHPKGHAANPNGGFRQWWDALQPIKPLTVSDDDGDNALGVQAYGLARVAHVSPVFNAGNLTRLCYTEFAKLPAEPEPWETTEQRHERFWRTLVTNSGGVDMQSSLAAGSRAPGPAVGDSFRSMMAQERILALLGCTPLELQSPSPELRARFQASAEAQSLVPLTGKGEDYESLLRSFALGRRFFRTEDGRFGMTTIEDVVAVDGNLAQERRRRSGGYSSTTNTGTTEGASGDDDSVPTENSEEQTGSNLGRMMGDPMARAMLESFQQYLTTRDPNAANFVSQLVRGDLPDRPQGEGEGEEAGEGQAPAPGVKQGVQPGDLVVALVGGFFPYILRPVVQQQQEPDEESTGESAPPLPMADATYQFVGDCYLYGAMDGEDFFINARDGQRALKVVKVDKGKIVDIRIV